jgi:hypothetical protein
MAGAMEHDPSPDIADGEYGVVRIPDAWHVASLACFVAALGARFLVGMVLKIWDLGFLPVNRFLLPGVAVLLFAGLGVAFGVAGLKSPQGREAARVAIFLNTTVLLLALLATVAFFKILPG